MLKKFLQYLYIILNGIINTLFYINKTILFIFSVLGCLLVIRNTFWLLEIIYNYFFK